MDKADAIHLTLEVDWVWLVIRRDASVSPPEWHIQGVCSNEENALAMASDSTYVIGPLPIDTALPEKRIDWAGAYFPKK